MLAGYITMDIPPIEVVNSADFEAILRTYTLEYTKVLEKGKRGLYLIIMRNESCLFETDKPSVFQIFAKYKPKVICIINTKGVPYGFKKVKVTDAELDEEGNITKDAVWELQHIQERIELVPPELDEEGNTIKEGEYEFRNIPCFEINIPELMSFLPPKIVYDEKGEIIETTTHTEPFLPIVPAGWDKPYWI